MKYLKINNLQSKFGQYDYKGLDINQFIPCSQICSIDNTYCLIATNENITTLLTDVVELTEEQYTTERTSIENNIKQKSQSIEDRMSALEIAMANTMGV